MLAAQLAQVDAAIAEGEAALQTARSDFSRGAELLRGGSIATQVVEQRQSAARQAEAPPMLAPARARRSQSGWPRRGSSHPPMAWSFAARCSLAPSRRRARRCSGWSATAPPRAGPRGYPELDLRRGSTPARPRTWCMATGRCRQPCAPLRRWSRRTRVSASSPYRAAGRIPPAPGHVRARRHPARRGDGAGRAADRDRVSRGRSGSPSCRTPITSVSLRPSVHHRRAPRWFRRGSGGSSGRRTGGDLPGPASCPMATAYGSLLR